MDRLRLIDFVQERGQRRGFSASRGASQNDEARFFLRDLGKDGGQAQILKGRNNCLQLAHHDRKVALLPEDIHAKPRLLAERVAAIARTLDEVGAHQAPITLENGER